MKFKPVKTAVIGCGMISDIYLKNLRDTFSITELVGCSDLVDEKAAEKAGRYGIQKLTSEQIMRDGEIELVLNLTYPSSHFEVNQQLLQAKKNVYCEKMLCGDMDQAIILKSLKETSGVYFSIAPDTFLGGSLQSCRQYLEMGMIGEPIFGVIKLSRSYQMIKEDRDDAYRKFSVMASGGGIPYDMGGYYLHALFSMFGPVQRVCGFSKTRNQTRPYLNPRNSKFLDPYFVDTENTICGALEFQNGFTCTMAMTSESVGADHLFQICGTEGTLFVPDPNNFGDKIYIRRGGCEMTELPVVHPYTENSRGIAAADMAWAIRTGRPPRLSFEMGYHALEVIKAIVECTESNSVKTLRHYDHAVDHTL